MSFNGLMNHKGRIWRPTETRDAFKAVTKTYVPGDAPTVNNCRPAPIKWTMRDSGAGEASAVQGEVRRWFMRSDTDVQQRDVVEIIEGPETGRKVHVLDASLPHSHHWMLVVEPFHGTLTEPD